MNDNPYQTLDADFNGGPLGSDKLYVTEELCEQWKKTDQASYRLAMVGFSVLALIVMLVIGAMINALILPAPFLLVLAALGFVIFKLSQNLYRYSLSINEASEFSDWNAQERAFASLSSAYTIYGLCVLLTTIVLVGGFSYLVYIAIL